jgi:hypothetical protein
MMSAASCFHSPMLFCAILFVGYTCFWPNGGGLKESNPFKTHPNQSWDDNEGGYDGEEEDYDS